MLILLLAAAALYFGFMALAALRSGTATMHLRYGRDREFERRANPAAYWTVLGWYVALAVVCVVGVVIRVRM